MIVIPMAGMSSRFYKAGFTQPKYMLQAHQKSLFAHSVLSFKRYFDTDSFLFIVRDIDGTVEFVKAECAALGVRNYKIITLSAPTAGQAETVYLGLKGSTPGDEEIIIFNIDTIRKDYIKPAFIYDVDGYLEVFEGEGDNWSFAAEDLERPGYVTKTTEKDPISRLCSDGLYHFKNFSVYESAYQKMLHAGESGKAKGEYYVAPMYNYIIENGGAVRFDVVQSEKLIFSGTPDEYYDFLKCIVL